MTANHHQPTRTGSIYLITLITVAAIVSMVFIGVSLRSASNAKSTIIEQVSEESMGTIDAGEVAFEKIATDRIWRVTAQGGTVFAPITITNGGNTMASTVVDTATGLVPTYDTTSYRVLLSSANNTAAGSSQVDVLATQTDYLGFLNTLPLKDYWPLNEHSNPTLALDFKNKYPGTYQAPPVAGAGYNTEGGPVPVFANLTESVVIPWNKDFDQSEGGFSMWVKLTGTNKWGNNYAVLGMLHQLNGVPSINIALKWNAVHVYLNEKGDNKFSSYLTTPIDSITPGTWHNIVVTWGNAGLTIYIDGTQRAIKTSNTDQLKTAKLSKGGQQPLYVGGGYDMYTNPILADGFEGSVAHLVLFNRQLIASEVKALAAVRPSLRTYSIVPDSWQRLYDQ